MLASEVSLHRANEVGGESTESPHPAGREGGARHAPTSCGEPCGWAATVLVFQGRAAQSNASDVTTCVRTQSQTNETNVLSVTSDSPASGLSGNTGSTCCIDSVT